MTETITHGIKIVTNGTNVMYLDITNETYREVGAVEANIINKKIKGRLTRIREKNRLEIERNSKVRNAN